MLRIAATIGFVLLATAVQAQVSTTVQSSPALAETAERRAAQAAELLAANTRPFTLSPAQVSGPGADFLEAQTARSQFVLMGEAHFDHDIPIFALGLYRMLQERHGFDRLVVENDPWAMAAVDGFQGNLERTVDLARRYPAHIGFASDQDLRLYAAAAEGSHPGVPALWGIEQAQGATWYLEELLSLAPDRLRPRVQTLLDEARANESRSNPGAFLHDDVTTTDRLQALIEAWAPLPGSRGELLLSGLLRSSVIYGYNRRANAGERVGLYNNTEREQLFRENFITRYRADSAGGRTPRALFKMGSWHMYRGKSPGQAHTIANLAHEMAFLNGMEAYGIHVISVGGYVPGLSDHPAWMRPLLPDALPETPIVIDLRPLKPWAGLFAGLAPEVDRWQVRDLIQGFDALVLLPNSRRATWDLTGFPAP